MIYINISWKKKEILIYMNLYQSNFGILKIYNSINSIYIYYNIETIENGPSESADIIIAW